MDRLDREIVEQYVRGHREANRVIERERRERLRTITVEESLRIFRGLYALWARLGASRGEDTERLAQLHLAEAVTLRAQLNEAYRRSQKR